jgi:phage FluMu gp28-like protein
VDGNTRRVLAMLRMEGMRLPAQQGQLDVMCGLPRFRRGALDMTGLGLGLVEYAQEKWGSRIMGVNFAATEPVNSRIRAEGRKAQTARVTEIMATDLLDAFEERSLELCVELDSDARDDLRKPEKIVSPGGRVSIAAARNEAGHADHFWSLALGVRASKSAPGILRSFFAARVGVFGGIR